MTSAPASRHLYRSRRDRMVSGVCGGLAEYFGVDPIIVRLAFVLITLAGGSGILAYFVLAIVVPEEPISDLALLEEDADKLKRVPANPVIEHRNRKTAAIILILIGIVALAGNAGWLWWFDWGLLWPLVLVALGGVVLFRQWKAGE